MREVVIVDSVRTGLAKSFRGKFNLTRPDDMAAHCVDALLARNDLDPLLVDDCIVGAGSNEGAQGHNIGRNVAVLSGLGIQVPGMTLNRYCSSGLQAIAIAANQIASGCSEVIVAGGVESITLTLKSVNTDHLVNPLLQREVPGIYYPMGQTAEIVARRYGITREAQDAYALQSQQRMARAQADGLFADEIVPMTTRYAVEDKASGEKQVLDGVVDRDDCNRPDTTLEGLASLKRRLHRHRPPVRHDRLAPGRSSGPRTAPAQPALRRGDHVRRRRHGRQRAVRSRTLSPCATAGPAGRGSPHGFYLHDAPCHPRRLALG